MDRDSLMALGQTIVALNNRHDMAGLMALYAPRVTSVEAMAPTDGVSPVSRGRRAIEGKWKWWSDNHEVHSAQASGPFLHGEDRIGVIYELDVTHKASGQRMTMKELAIYTIRDGKVVREEFFY